MIEKDFDPQTMTRATSADILRIHRQLWGVGALAQFQQWGKWALDHYRMTALVEDGEYLDLTQINWRKL